MTDEMKTALKEVSLKYAEEFAKLAVNFAYDLANVAAAISENKIDDIAVEIANKAKENVLSLVDKIYKEEA